MQRLLFGHLPLIGILLTVWLLTETCDVRARDTKPNFVVIYGDDLGYGDLSCFGNQRTSTPNLDRMAAEGVKLTDFHVAAAVCSASRAALLTGCYPQRIGILEALGPKAKIGINADELLIPELLGTLGYTSAIYGKWHLGDAPQFLPLQNGFDDYFGLPYSNDMWPNHPTNKNFPVLPLFERNKVVELNPDQTRLTTWYTERAVKFIETNRDKPFFLYVPHNMPHVPLFVSEKFAGKSVQGRYGDVLMEIDWSVGQILEAIRKSGLDENTIVIFASDNGPWLSYGDHAGTAGSLREGKGTTWEGGHRVPFIARWPKRIPAGTVCDELAATIDLLPTLVAWAGGTLPQALKIDGQDIGELLTIPGTKTPHEVFYYYWDYRLEAIRSGPWKLHFPHSYRSLKGEPGNGGQPGPYVEAQTELALFNLNEDVGERTNVINEHGEVVARLNQLAEVAPSRFRRQASRTSGCGDSSRRAAVAIGRKLR